MSDTHQFKPGEHALLEVEIGERLPVSSEEYYYHAVAQSDIGGRRKYYIPTKASRLHPAPREGEYRFTVEELQDMLDDFVEHYEKGGLLNETYPSSLRTFATNWLAEHGKEGA